MAVSGGTAITGAEDDTKNKTEGLQIRRVWRQLFRRDQRPAACPAVLRNPVGMLAGPQQRMSVEHGQLERRRSQRRPTESQRWHIDGIPRPQKRLACKRMRRDSAKRAKREAARSRTHTHRGGAGRVATMERTAGRVHSRVEGSGTEMWLKTNFARPKYIIFSRQAPPSVP